MANQPSERDGSDTDLGDDRHNELFDVLSDPRRRFVLHTLRGAETPVPVAELAVDLVTWESQRSAPDRSGDGRDAVEVALVHIHLPKMAEAGLVRYDETQQTVSLADRGDEVRTHLQTVAGD